VLDVLRQPLEDKVVTISRAQGTLTFPSNFMLVAAMNPCPCGYFGDPLKACCCGSSEITRYQKKISGPLLDRIDIQIDVPRVDIDKLTDTRKGESSSQVRARVEAARKQQLKRLQHSPRSCNSDMAPKEVREYCVLDNNCQTLLRGALQQLGLSARAYHRVLKLSRTIADLAGGDQINNIHLAEALQYQSRDEQ
jgi:magnesium chelatase family protein